MKKNANDEEISEYYKNARTSVAKGLGIEIKTWDYENPILQHTNLGCGVVLLINALNRMLETPLTIAFGKQRANELSENYELSIRMQLFVYLLENMQTIQSSLTTKNYTFLDKSELEKLKNNLQADTGLEMIKLTYQNDNQTDSTTEKIAFSMHHKEEKPSTTSKETKELNKEEKPSAKKSEINTDDLQNQAEKPRTIKWTTTTITLFIIGCITVLPVALIVLGIVSLYNYHQRQKFKQTKSIMPKALPNNPYSQLSGDPSKSKGESKPEFSSLPTDPLTGTFSYAPKRDKKVEIDANASIHKKSS